MDPLPARIAEQQREQEAAGALIATFRLVIGVSFLVLVAIVSRQRNTPEWDRLLVLQSVYVVASVLVWAAVRLNRWARRYAAWSMALLDIPAIHLCFEALVGGPITPLVATSLAQGLWGLLVLYSALTLAPRILWVTAGAAVTAALSTTLAADSPPAYVALSILTLVAIAVAAQVVQRRQLRMTARILAEVEQQAALEHQLSRSDRLATIGELAAGVAHEIANPLTVVFGCLQLLDDEVGDAGREDHSRALDACGRALAVLRDFRRLGLIDDQPARPTDVNAIVESSLRICRPFVRPRAEIQQELTATRAVLGHDQRLSQVMLNLIRNAVDAMPAGRKGNKLRVRTADDGDRVILQVADNGVGMTEEQQRKIFSAFHTTKVDGTGLGLSIVKRIVNGYGGSISVASEPEVGTTFTIRLPTPLPIDTSTQPQAPAPRVSTAGAFRVQRQSSA